MAEPIYLTAAQFKAMAVAAPWLTDVATADIVSVAGSVSRFMDSFFRSKFVMPLTQWGDEVSQACADLVGFRLFVKNGAKPGTQGIELIRKAYEDAVSWLKLVGAGDATPDVTDSSYTPAQGADPEPQVITGTQRGWSSRGQFGPSGPWGGFQGD